MSDRTQDIKNLRAVATACKNYTDKKIEDLRWELGTYDLGVESDNTSALVKTMPSGTIKANVNKIYGASEVSGNNKGNSEWISGYYNATTGEYETASNYVCNNNFYCPVKANTTYIYTSTPSRPLYIHFYASDKSYLGHTSIVNNGSTFTTPNNCAYIRYNTTSGQTSTTNLVMINEGTTALPYEEYKGGYDGIHNIELTGLKVEGSNKWDENFEIGSIDISTGQNITSSAACRCKNYQSVLPNTTYILNYVYRAFFYDSNKNYLGYVGLTNTSGTGAKFTTPYNCAYVRFNFVSEYGTTYLNNIRLNLGTTLLAYVPYITPTTKTIDLTTILYNGSPLFEDNAIKKIGTAVDNIQPYKAHKEIGKKVLNGTEDWEIQWQYDSTNDIGSYRTTISDIKQITSESTVGNILTDKLDVVSQLSLAQNSNTGICVRANTSNIIIKIVGKNCSTVEAFKTYLQSNPIILYYELATPIEVCIDWSATLRNIQGYSNGSITAQNTYDMATTSEIDYLVEEVKA